MQNLQNRKRADPLAAVSVHMDLDAQVLGVVGQFAYMDCVAVGLGGVENLV